MSDPGSGSRVIHRPVRRAAPDREGAEALAVGALAFVADHPDLASRFLSLSGLEADGLRAAVARPSFFPNLLDFILADERTLLAFAGHAGVSPNSVADARRALGQPGADRTSP